MKVALLAAAIVITLGLTASSIVAGTRGTAKNHPPYFPKVKRTKTTTNFQYDDTGNLMGAVTTITLLSKPVDPDHDRLRYTWKASNGKIRGKGLSAVWTRACCLGGGPSAGTVTLVVGDGHGGKATAKFVFS
jgi:hypothetical protein